MTHLIRPMTAADAPVVHEVASTAFAALGPESGEEPPVTPDLEAAHQRIEHLVRTDPGGAWVAERDGKVVGAALALVREQVWGLSLLAVLPEHQSDGAGRQLLAAARAHGDTARGFIVCASDDSRALRVYSRLGLRMHPCAVAHGVPRGVTASPEVRVGGVEDLEWCNAVDRDVRGASHGDDYAVGLRSGSTELLVLPDRGYLVLRGPEVYGLAARDVDAAAALLRTGLARGEQTRVRWLSADQHWAVAVCVEAGLALSMQSPVFRGGELGPMTPYLPSGSYL